MSDEFISTTLENLETEHLCCAIADKKHQCGVTAKKQWLQDRIPEGHIFRKLDARGKVFIEYAPLETAWVTVNGDNYLYVYCLWVSGSYKGKGYAKSLIEHCINDAKRQGKSGVCVLSSKKKMPFLSEKKFLLKYGFQVVDNSGEYELLALAFADSKPAIADSAKQNKIASKNLTVYYSNQCPYIPNCIAEIKNHCAKNAIPLELFAIDTLEKAKSVPCIFNNWAVFYNGEFQTLHLLNEGYLKKLLNG